MSFSSRLHFHSIADLHCDLLCYLSRNDKHTPHDLSARCSIPQLKEGNVKLQTMAIFTETAHGSLKKGNAQAQAYRTLMQDYSSFFEPIHQPEQLDLISQSGKIGILPAIENASSICEEGFDLEDSLTQFTHLQRKIGKVAYISLTWNTENRFGGGALTKAGLKEDGKRLLDYMCARGIPLDFSHASDYLAFDILNYIDKMGMDVPVMASHSNMRAITDVPRNMPDDLVHEILRRKGIIGLNFFRNFVGRDSPDNFIKHLEHLLKIGGERQVCFGADFFDQDDLPPAYQKPPSETFFPFFDTAGTYHKVLDLWRKHLNVTESTLANICYHNAANFLKSTIFSINEPKRKYEQ